MLTRVIGETHIGITHEEQYGLLKYQQSLVQVLCIRLCDPTTFTVPPFGNSRHFLAALRQNGSIPFEVLPAFGLALVDHVADPAQQLLHQARPTVIVGFDGKGEIPKEMRPAYLMLAQGVCKVCCPAIVDQRTGVEQNDAERADGFLAPLAMQELERQDTVAGYVQPPVLLVDPDAGFISMKGRACQKVFPWRWLPMVQAHHEADRCSVAQAPAALCQ